MKKKWLIIGTVILALIIFLAIYFYQDTSNNTTCISEGGNLGAVIPGNYNECCEGLVAYIPEGAIGTRGTCVQE